MPKSLPLGAERPNTGKMNRWRVKTPDGWKLRSIVVMEQKLGHRIPEGHIVHHKDEDTTNDHPENLELVEWGEHNRIHNIGKKFPGRGVRGERHPLHKLTGDKVRRIRELYASGKFSQKQLAEMFGVSQPMIGKIVRGESWA